MSINDVLNRLDRTGFFFFMNDVELALTMTRIAREGSDDSEKRARNQKNARRAYDTVTGLTCRVALTGEEEQELARKLTQLKSELQSLGEQF